MVMKDWKAIFYFTLGRQLGGFVSSGNQMERT